MFVPFSTILKTDNTLTQFVGKILSAYGKHRLGDPEDHRILKSEKLAHFIRKAYGRGLLPEFDFSPTVAEVMNKYFPKIHTIRRGDGDRWREGLDVQPVINNRTPDVYQFAPNTPFVTTQKIILTLTCASGNREEFLQNLVIEIDDRTLGTGHERLILNDGLTVEQFAGWFFPTHNKSGKKQLRPDGKHPEGTFEGHIIHYTEFTYS